MFQYEPFRDSTEHLNDGETLRARLAGDGYLFLRGLLPRKAILDVRARLLQRRWRVGGCFRTRSSEMESPTLPLPARIQSRAI